MTGTRLRGVARNLGALALGIGLVALIEGVLFVAGVSPLAEEDPFVGFEGSLPLFVESPGGSGAYSLNPAKGQYFNPQGFRMPKPEGTFRIISFGGSTTYGRPYLDMTSFPAWTAAILSRADGNLAYESVNAGGISYASYRVRRLAQELARFSPDLYVVYSGHNEFLESRTFEDIREEHPGMRRLRGLLHRSRLYSLLYRGFRKVRGASSRTKGPALKTEVHAMLEEIGGPELYHRDEAFRRGVIRQYRRNIEAIVRIARSRGIPLVLCTLPSNLSGVSPFKSEHRPGLEGDGLAAWERAFGEAVAAFEAGLPGQALARIAEAEEADDRYALLHYLKGLCLQALGRHGEALEAFVRAKEEDIIPLRALEAFNDILREVARSEGVPLADVEDRFRRASPEGISGPPLFVDHVHPDIRWQQEIALVIVDTAVGAGLVPLPQERWEVERPAAEAFLARRLAALPPRYRAMGIWGVGRLFHWAGKYPEAYAALSEAWRTVRDVPDIPYLLGDLESRRGNIPAALGYFGEAARLDPGDGRALGALAWAQMRSGLESEARATFRRHLALSGREWSEQSFEEWRRGITSPGEVPGPALPR